MSALPVTICGSCGCGRLDTVLEFGSSPPTCNMRPVGKRAISETHYPLELLRCDDCTLVQLSVIVDPAEVFPPDYPYSSGNSRELHDNFGNLADQFPLGPDDLVVDIGANDGTLLTKFRERYACRTVAVEPTLQADKAPGAVYRDFFSAKVAVTVRAEHGPAKLVTASNVLAHVDDLDSVMAGVAWLLAGDGTLVAENHDLASIVDGGQWDAVYHEHLRFFDPHSFWRTLDRHGIGAQGWKPVPTHGGSFRMWGHKGHRTQAPPSPRDYAFAAAQLVAREARAGLRAAVAAYGRVWGVGATARATTTINYCGLDVEDVAVVCELPGSDKVGRYIPGTRIPVVDEAALYQGQPDAAVLFSWHLADRIAPKLREHGYGGDIIVPLTAAHGLV